MVTEYSESSFSGPAARPSRMDKIRSVLQTLHQGQDRPNKYETPEWVEAFQTKESILSSVYLRAMLEEFYVELFGSLDAKCALLLDEEQPATAVSFQELEPYIAAHDHVFLYTQRFASRSVDRDTGRVRWYAKTYDALVGFRCFVIDVDEVGPADITAVIERIRSAPIHPNYINLTGNGLHLYYMFDVEHDVKHAAWLMAKDNKTTVELERAAYAAIKQGMISWFHDLGVKSDVSNHLAQPSRLPTSKTKNRNVRTILFKGTDTKHTIQHIAELFRITLPDEERVRQWKKEKEAENRRRSKEKKKSCHAATLDDLFDYDAPENEVVRHDSSVTTPDVECDNPNSKFRFNFDWLPDRILSEEMEERNSMEYLLTEEMRRLRAEYKASPEYQHRKVAQRRGLESQYNQFKKLMLDGARDGNRNNVLHVFWNRAPMYQKDNNVIFRDFCDLLMHCNSLSYRKITEDQVYRILNGPRYTYSNDTIFERTGIDVSFTNKKTEQMRKRKDDKWKKWEVIVLLCEAELTMNPKLSDRKLTKILNDHGIEVSQRTISNRKEVKDLRARLRLQ